MWVFFLSLSVANMKNSVIWSKMQEAAEFCLIFQELWYICACKILPPQVQFVHWMTKRRECFADASKSYVVLGHMEITISKVAFPEHLKRKRLLFKSQSIIRVPHIPSRIPYARLSTDLLHYKGTLQKEAWSSLCPHSTSWSIQHD